MRMRGLVGKEFLQVAPGPEQHLAIAFVLPVVLLLLFGYGVSLDAEHVPIAMVVEKPTPDTNSFCGELEHSLYFEPVYVHGMPAAQQAMMERRVDAILHLREDFSEKLRRPGGAPVQLIVNGVDANTARIINGYVDGALASGWSTARIENGSATRRPVDLEHAHLVQRQRPQPQLSRARRDGRDHDADRRVADGDLDGPRMGTRHDGSADGHAGFDAGSTAGQDPALFHPGHGRIGALGCDGVCGCSRCRCVVRSGCCCWRSSLFLLMALGMGLFISTRNAQCNLSPRQVAIITTFLPAFILSGFIFDIGSMPRPIQWITHVVPARYYVVDLENNCSWPAMCGR